MRFLVGVVAAALLLVPVQRVEAALADVPKGGWADAGTLSTDRGGPIGVRLQSGRVLVTGTSSDDLSGLGYVDLYDPGTGWSLGPKLQGDPQGAVVAPLPGGGALLAGGVPWFGGFDGPGPGPTATAMVYDPATNSWRKAHDMSVARSDATASPLPDGRVLVVGGYDRRVIQLPNPTGQPFCCIDVRILPLATTEIFNPTSTTWTPGPALAQGRSGHVAVALKDGRILIVGGHDQSHDPGRILDSAELFDLATGHWLNAGTVGPPRTQFTLTALSDGRALLVGGLSEDGSTVLSSTLLYDPATNQWSRGPDLANARTGHAAAVLPDGKVLVTGGADQLGRLASSELFDPSTNSWSAAGALATPRSGHLAISLSSGRILVIGGQGSVGALKTSEMFDLSATGMPAPDRAPAGRGRWELAAAPPVQTLLQSVQVLADGRVLVLPESVGGTFTAELYDPASNSWTTPISRTSGQASFVASPLDNGRVLLLTLDQQSGSPGKAEVIDLKSGAARSVASPGDIHSARLDLLPDGRVWLTEGPYEGRQSLLYDPAADRWTASSDLPADLGIQTVTAMPGGRLLVGGVNQAMVYDPASGAWTSVGTFPPSPGGWTGYSAARLPSGDVLLIGGAVETTLPDGRLVQVVASRIIRWDHTTGMLAPAQTMPQPVANGSTAVLADGTVLLAGGNAVIGGDPLPGVEIYNPATSSWSAAASLPVARAQAATVTLADGRLLLVGGYGMFGAQPSLLFSPHPQTRTTANATSTWNAETFAGMGSVLFTVVAVLVSWQLVVRTRRRNRSMRPRG